MQTANKSTVQLKSETKFGENQFVKVQVNVCPHETENMESM